MKHGKVILAAIVTAVVMNLSFADAPRAATPKGWTANGAIGDGYVIGFDPAEKKDGRPSVFIEGRDNSLDKFAALSQTFDARPWQGKTVRFSVVAKTLDDSSKAEIWLRGVDSDIGKDVERKSAESPARRYEALNSAHTWGKEWKEIAIAMVVTPNMDKVEIGVGMRGAGKVWIRDAKVVEMPAEERREREKRRPIAQAVPLAPLVPAPVNLELAE